HHRDRSVLNKPLQDFAKHRNTSRYFKNCVIIQEIINDLKRAELDYFNRPLVDFRMDIPAQRLLPEIIVDIFPA
ncbi:MAG: hypothetical protein WAV07_07100, partial [Candidatus Contendobacter sp.]